MRRRIGLIVCLAAVLGGCGGSGHVRQVSLVLDFTPNAIHTGIYTAAARGYDRANDVRLHIIAPSASTDSIKLLQTRRVEFAILDIHDLAIARSRGVDVVAVMPIVQRPLAAVIAVPKVTSPRQLAGRVVGISGVPSDTAVLHSTVAGAGGDPHGVKTITIGFNAVDALLSGRVAAATAFWNDEGVTLARTRRGFHIFRVDAFGAPSYPELVLCVTRRTLLHDGRLVRETVSGIVEGYRATLADPGSSARELESAVPSLDRRLVGAQLAAELPAFSPVGRFDIRRLRAWALWEARFGIVARPPKVSDAFDPSVAAAASRSRSA